MTESEMVSIANAAIDTYFASIEQWLVKYHDRLKMLQAIVAQLQESQKRG